MQASGAKLRFKPIAMTGIPFTGAKLKEEIVADVLKAIKERWY